MVAGAFFARPGAAGAFFAGAAFFAAVAAGAAFVAGAFFAGAAALVAGGDFFAAGFVAIEMGVPSSG